jgi:hypothetical protein
MTGLYDPFARVRVVREPGTTPPHGDVEPGMNRRLLILAPLIGVSLLACDGRVLHGAPVPSNLPTPAAVPGTGDATGGGWIGGEPQWTTSYEGSSGAAGGEAMPMTDAVSESAGTGSKTAGPTRAGDDAAVPMPEPVPGPVSQDGIPLRAGSVDDNADFSGYLDYLARYRELCDPERTFDPTGRIVVTVTGANGLPAKGVPVSIAAGGVEVARLRTSATGRAIFLPATYGAVQAGYHVAVGGADADASPGTDVQLTIAADGGAPAGMPVDVLFLLDVTGSMGDEISQLKTTIADVSDRLEQLPQHPDIRFAMTLFRDEGDTFVTSTFDFTGDVAAFQKALDDVTADGGGDTPEAVDEAFAAGLSEPSWRDPASAVQMVFLVGDAAPHIERQLSRAYPQSIHEAAARGITVNVVAASATDDQAEHAFRAVAQGTGGRFVFLAYGAGGAALGEHTDIASTDYEELSLDDLVVRLVAEELSTLTGNAIAPPPQINAPISPVTNLRASDVALLGAAAPTPRRIVGDESIPAPPRAQRPSANRR